MIKRAIQIIMMIAILAAVLFLGAGRTNWLWAWVFLGLYLAGIAANAVLMLRINRETIAQRADASGMKDWDKAVGGLWTLMYFLLTPLIAGLDVRLGWTGPVSLGIHLAGGGLFVLGFALFSWAMVSNAFFSTVVRIQQERGHTVCTHGPYGFVRHPGYAGAIAQSLALPLLLGSAWALVPGSLAGVLMIVRTTLEDRTLQAELAGYGEYTKQVRYRLVPGIW